MEGVQHRYRVQQGSRRECDRVRRLHQQQQHRPQQTESDQPLAGREAGGCEPGQDRAPVQRDLRQDGGLHPGASLTAHREGLVLRRWPVSLHGRG